ncbi:hypothetical protein B4065_3364 [Caldibacillus thermoamylovorans]|uniref:phage tail spike protein n=1 Tax=Caldibacillus thermoamylovorans TaxID=35841 RepID=UPI0005B6ABEF|nr:phage tail spike protein [Caldibacillus thermoamylovorans]KIO62144.1 hypothetical protein B4065_3364 [Caldibacillus thermoamylovorans]
MAELYIFSPEEKLLTVLSEDTGLVDTHYRIEVNSVPDTPFSFTVEADSENAKHVKEENKVVFRDHEGDWRMMVIRELDDSDSIDGPETTAICEPIFLAELNDHIVVDRRFNNTRVDVALNAALDGTRWIGVVEVDLGLASTNFYYLTSVEAIWETINTWGGEVKDVIEFDIETNEITACKIKLIQRLGTDTGQRFEIDHNITEISRTVLSYPKTALYGRGASLETEGGGHTRYIDFADVEWKKSNGDPVDKPLGQKWVGDPELLAKFGYENGTKHRFGIYKNHDIEDPAELLEVTWNNLQEVASKVEVNYRLSVDLFDDKVSLGDTAIAIDRYFARPIEIQARIIAIEYDLLDIEDTMVVEMGQFLNLGNDDLYRDVAKLKEEVNKPPKKEPITNDSFPDIKPGTPVNVQAIGGFKVIQLYWEYDSNVYISHYEVYGSQVKDFVPDSQHLLYRGKVSSFAHEVNTDEVWYYRVRAVNTRGTPGDFSPEVSASTVRIISDDILFGEDIASELRELSKTAQLLADGTIDLSKLADEVTNEIDTAKTSANDAVAKANLATNNANKAMTQAQTAFDDAQLALTTVTGLQGDVTNLSTLVNDHTGQISAINQSVAGLQTQVSDIDDNVSTVTQTVSSLTTRISDAEGNITTLQQTSSSFATRISTAEGNISTLTQTTQGLQTTVSNVQGDLSTVTQTANALQTRMTNAEGNISTLTATANSLTSSITAVRSDLDNLEIGGRNLLLGTSNTPIKETFRQNANEYRVSESSLQELFRGGEYVASVIIDEVISAPKGVTIMLSIRNSDRSAYYQINSTETFYVGDRGRLTGYFNIPVISDPEGKYATVHLRDNYDSKDNIVIYKSIKLEKGNKATDWTPAPEDMATQSQFTQLADAINLRVQKGDVINQINLSTEGILIDGAKVHITGQTLIDNAVIKTAHIADAAITSAKIANLAVGTAAIANGAITQAKLGTAVIGTAQIEDGSITNAKIANLAIDSAKIANGTITDAKIASLNVDKLTGSWANFVQTGFNGVSASVKISGFGLGTYWGPQRTSLLDGNGHHFYRNNTYIGKIGTNTWIDDSNYRGLVFDLETSADYMAWAYRIHSSSTSYTTIFAWHRTSSKSNKGFTFNDDVYIDSRYALKFRYFRTLNYMQDERGGKLINMELSGNTGFAITNDAETGGIFIGNDGRISIGYQNSWYDFKNWVVD